MPGLFVSYRRDDSQGFAGRLADDLDAAFGHEHVFRDVEIPVGSNFGAVLHRAIADCDVLIVVIGRHWAGRTEAGRASRLFDADDWVRAEIEAALAHGTWIVPVLVGGATMPPADELPASLGGLCAVQAAVLDDRRWDADVADLIAQLRRRIPSLALDVDESATGTPRGPRLASRLFDALARTLGRSAGRALKRVVSVLTVLAVLYVGLRLFGDAGTLRTLDALESRLHVGWERLLAFARRW